MIFLSFCQEDQSPTGVLAECDMIYKLTASYSQHHTKKKKKKQEGHSRQDLLLCLPGIQLPWSRPLWLSGKSTPCCQQVIERWTPLLCLAPNPEPSPQSGLDTDTASHRAVQAPGSGHGAFFWVQNKAGCLCEAGASCRVLAEEVYLWFSQSELNECLIALRSVDFTLSQTERAAAAVWSPGGGKKACGVIKVDLHVYPSIFHFYF